MIRESKCRGASLLFSIFALLALLVLSPLVSQAKDLKYALLTPSKAWIRNNPYEFGAGGVNGKGLDRAPEQVIAWGDLHGNLSAAIQILLKLKIIDKDLNWIAGDVLVVNPGDVLDGQSDAKVIFDLFRILEPRARAKGCRFRFTLGNHEILGLLGKDKHMSGAQQLLFEKGDPRAADFETDAGIRALLLDPNEPYAEWLTSLDVITVFNRPPAKAGERNRRMGVMHAGVNPEWLPDNMKDWPDDPLIAINYTARIWTTYLVDHARAKELRRIAKRDGRNSKDIPLPERPPLNTGWVIGIDSDGKLDQTLGPLNDRTNKINFDPIDKGDGFVQTNKRAKGAPTREEMLDGLGRFGLYGYIMGHAPNKDGSIHQSSRFGDRVFVVDSHMAFGGKVTYLVYDRIADENGKPCYYQSEISLSAANDPEVMYAIEKAKALSNSGRTVGAQTCSALFH